MGSGAFLFLSPAPEVRLTALDLSHCENLEDAFIEFLVESPSAATLRRLTLDYCRRLTAGGIQKLGLLIARKQLTALSLKNNFRDVDPSVFLADGDNALVE